MAGPLDRGHLVPTVDSFEVAELVSGKSQLPSRRVNSPIGLALRAVVRPGSMLKSSWADELCR